MSSITPAALGSLIADEMETKGHYKQGSGDSNAFGACLILSDAWDTYCLFDNDNNVENRRDFLLALADKVGILRDTVECRDYLTDEVIVNSYPLTQWNDDTPTDEVLSTLRSL
jgi:hypothetical protein